MVTAHFGIDRPPRQPWDALTGDGMEQGRHWSSSRLRVHTPSCRGEGVCRDLKAGRGQGSPSSWEPGASSGVTPAP